MHEYITAVLIINEMIEIVTSEHLLRAAALDPKYAQPRIWAAYAYMNHGELTKADAFILTKIPFP